jgi:hypothetical protein
MGGTVIEAMPADVHPLVLLALVIWSIAWTGLALWKSAQNKQKYWFIAMLILSTAGILEIVYLLFFQKKGNLVKKFLKKKRASK